VIPPNTTATVYLPSVEPASVTESGKPAEQAEAVKLLRRDADASVYEVGAGRFVFEAKMK